MSVPEPVGAVGELWWHVHHDILAENLIEPASVRRAYIDTTKPEAEVALRLALMQPIRSKAVRDASAACQAAYNAYQVAYPPSGAFRAVLDADAALDAALDAAHDVECPDCPWDGLTIFP